MTVETSTWATKKGLAQMLKGGVIMDVVTPDQAKIAEDAGAVAVMALERVPADIRKAGGVARMSDPSMIEGIMDAVTIPVMAKARIGHFVEAQVLEALGVDYIDESEVLTPADESNHIDKHAFKVPFVCGCRNLGEALRRINEGAAMMRTKGEAGTGNIVEAVRQLRDVLAEMRRLQGMREDELFVAAKELRRPYELVKQVAADGKLPVVNFVAGGISTPADAALVMQLGAEGVFVGSGIFKCEDPARMANAIVQATTFFDDPKKIAEVSKGLGAPMRGIAARGDPGRRSGSPSAAGRATDGARWPAASRDEDRRARPPGGVPRASRHAPRHRRRGRPRARAGRSRRRQRPDPARRREHDDAPAHRALGPAPADPRPGRPRRPDLRHVRRDDRPRPRDRRRRAADPAAPRRDGRAQRLRPPARLVRGGAVGADPRRPAGPRVFIRAPIIERTSPDVDVLARLDDGRIVAVRERNILATAFHPELAGETRFHRLWRRWPPSTTTQARAPAGGPTRPGAARPAR